MNISIYTCYHDKCNIINDKIFKYIFCGSAINDQSKYIKNTLRDDSGDNISYKNKSFCECTALYWVWKNDTISEYIGFMHYRRFLNFSEEQNFHEDVYGLINTNNISELNIQKFELNESSIIKLLSKYDVILPKKFNVSSLGHKNIYSNYMKNDYHKINDYNIALKILIKKHPSYKDIVKKINNGKYAYFTNIFIMKRDLFNNYCTFLFSILFELEYKLDLSKYSPQEYRSIAYISERIFTIFIEKTIEDKIKYIELQRIFIINPYIEKPLQDNIFIPIVLAFDNNFCKYASACLLSIIESASIYNKYVIYILYTRIDQHNIEKILKLQTQNIKIQFINCYLFFQNSLYTGLHFSRESYFRLSIPSIFDEFEKIIYIDSDTIVKKDLYHLYKIDINEYAIAGVRDYIMLDFCDKNIIAPIEFGNISAEQYINEYLKIDKNNYINAGVLIFNIKKINELKLQKRLIDLTKNKYWFSDQCIINIVFENYKYFLNITWNIAHGNDYSFDLFKNYKKDLHDEYFSNYNDANIIHFAGDKKPWIFSSINLSDEFWRNARKSPFYEEIIESLIINNFKFYNTAQYKVKFINKKINHIINILFPYNSRRRHFTKLIYYPKLQFQIEHPVGYSSLMA